MTYSIGFRAPSRAELIEAWADDMVTDLSDSDRYTDAGLTQQDNPGEISTAAIARLQAMIAETLHDQTRFARWFGQYTTAPKNPEIDWQPEDTVDADGVARELDAGAPVIRNPASRFAFVRTDGSSVMLFADGAAYACTGAEAEFAQAICAQPQVEVTRSSPPDVRELIAALYNAGAVAFGLEDQY